MLQVQLGFFYNSMPNFVISYCNSHERMKINIANLVKYVSLEIYLLLNSREIYTFIRGFTTNFS